jgi:hypothetical protein
MQGGNRQLAGSDGILMVGAVRLDGAVPSPLRGLLLELLLRGSSGGYGPLRDRYHTALGDAWGRLLLPGFVHEPVVRRSIANDCGMWCGEDQWHGLRVATLASEIEGLI